MRLRSARVAASATALALTCLVLSACNVGEAFSGSPDSGSPDSGDPEAAESPSTPTIDVNVGKAATGVPVDRRITIATDDGRLTKVNVTSEAGRLAGSLSKDGTTWSSTDGLEPGVKYAVSAVATNDGERVRLNRGFATQELTLDQQTYPSVSPLPGETVGVGMPVIVNFDIPVTERKNIERNLHVRSTPRQPGTWHWLSDQEVHWRPKRYWKSGTEVTVDVDINGVHAGNGIYGQEDRKVDFTVGDANILKVDIANYSMKVFSNGKLLRTLPVTTGEQPKYTTRSGVKVIMSKHESYDFNSGTIGIDPESADGYDLKNVPYAMRITNSGEFIHAAPWSVGSQGSANVSHGCTGLSPENAGWLFSIAKRGDVVEYVGSDRGVEYGNGFADWNLTWPEYKDGSALG